MDWICGFLTGCIAGCIFGLALAPSSEKITVTVTENGTPQTTRWKQRAKRSTR